MNTDGVLDPDMAVRAVMETDAADLNVLSLSEDEELWAAVLVAAEKLTHPPHKSLTLHRALSFNLDALDILEGEEVGDTVSI